jgi:type III secretion protein J
MKRLRWALLLWVAACSTPIRHGLDEPAANEITTALERAGIGAEKLPDEAAGPNTFVVRVAQGDAVQALDLLHTLGLPRGRRAGFAEVYGQPSLIPTATEERARYVEALAGEIERTLETVDGVAEARVHLVLEETDPLDSKPRVAAQASVLLKTRPGLPQIKDGEVQKLVAGSVPGLTPAAVTVVATPAAEARATPTLAPVGPLRVTAGTRSLLIATLVVALAVLAGLSVLLLFTARRLAAAQRALADR